TPTCLFCVTFFVVFFLMILRPPISTLFPYTTLFRSLYFSAKTSELACPSCASTAAISTPSTMVPCGYTGIFPVSMRTLNCGSRRSEEHTSELQSQSNLVCRLLLEKKKNTTNKDNTQD